MIGWRRDPFWHSPKLADSWDLEDQQLGHRKGVVRDPVVEDGLAEWKEEKD